MNKMTKKLKLTSTRMITVVLWATTANEVVTLPPSLARNLQVISKRDQEGYLYSTQTLINVRRHESP